MRLRFSAALLLAACSSTDAPDHAPPAFVPPATRQVEVFDDYHGTSIPDPYRWLEDQDGAEVRGWVEAQNELTGRFLAGIPERESIRARLTELWNHERIGPPSRQGPLWVWSRNDGLQNQSVLYRGAQPFQGGEVLLDPNTLSSDGTVALGGASFSEDGRWLAYSLSRSGSDWREWHVLEVATGRRTGDRLEWSKFSGATWNGDGSGFFYQRYRAPAEGETYEAENKAPQLCFHRLGTPQSQDLVVYERPDQPEWSFGATLGDDKRHLIVSIRQGTDRRNRIAWIDLEQGMDVQPLLMEFDASYGFLGNDGRKLYFVTDRDAPRRRIVAISLDAPAPEQWQTVVPERPDSIDSASLFGDRIVVTYLHDAHHRVAVFRTDGQFERELPLPGIGAVGGFGGRRSDPEGWFSFTSFTTPPEVWRYDPAAGTVARAWQPTVPFDPTAFETRQVFLQSRDGTRLPMFVVHRKGIRLDGSHPTYLYGYGGFNVSLTPSFSVARLVWIELGGIYAQPTLRGGGEYGEQWHRAGMLENKQRVFDDFLAAAEYLVRNDYTQPARLGIGGGSNGGLLVGAAMVQRPELFGAAVPEVGVMDMLRYHKFTIGWAWAPEYGRSDDAAMFPVLRAYSPLHNIRPGVEYPATLVMTGDHDDRVLPGHSYKFAATLQQAQTGPDPILIRIETKAGHGAGTPTTKLIDAATDRWAFLRWALLRS
jgi:prolyl oligopeptidase